MDDKNRDKIPSESAWVVEPPTSDQVVVSVGMGPDVKMTPEVRKRLSALVDSLLSGDDLAALDLKCGGAYEKCLPFSCSLDECQPLKKSPTCLSHTTCKIKLED